MILIDESLTCGFCLVVELLLGGSANSRATPYSFPLLILHSNPGSFTGNISSKRLPQLVVLTFDDSVNDLNKGLYQVQEEEARHDITTE